METPFARSEHVTPLDFLWSIAALLLFFVRYGYAFGTGDQDEVLPFLLHIIDPDVLANDWFVGLQASAFSVRTFFVWALRPLAFLMPVEVLSFVTYVALWLWIGAAVLALCRRISGSQPAGVLAGLATLVLFHKWTLGGNDLVYTMLVPEMAAWALALPALGAFLDGRTTKTGVLLGVACLFQLLVGLLTSGALVLVTLLDPGTEIRTRIRRSLSLSLAFGILGLPALAPIAMQQLEASSGIDPERIFYILAAFRNPFHHLAFSFGVAEWLKFLLVTGAGLIALRPVIREPDPERTFVARFALVTLLLCALAIGLTEVYPVLLVAKFQVYKLTVLTKLLLVAVAAGVAASKSASWIAQSRTNRLRIRHLLLAGALVGSFLLLLSAHSQVRWPWQGASRDGMAEVERWARSESPQGAVFAIPPSIGSFRYGAQRAIVVNYGAFPFRDRDMIEWYDRLMSVAPIEPPLRGIGIKTELDSAFHQLDERAWRSVCGRYECSYLLMDRAQMKAPLELPVAYESGAWTVYRIAGPN